MHNGIWRILMVDDDREDYYLVREMLAESRRGKFQLKWASSYSEGTEAIESDGYDAVLVDYNLGPDSGVDLIQAAVQAGCQTPILLLTGRGNYEIDLEAMQVGAADYLNKNDLNPALLERSIRFAIERKRTESERERLLEENRRQRVLLERIMTSSLTAIAVLDGPQHRFILTNPAFDNLAQKGNLIGKTIAEGWPETTHDALALLDQVYRTGQPVRAVDQPIELARPGGVQETLYLTYALSPFYDNTGNVVGIVITSEDVTESHQLRVQQAEYSAQMEVQRRLMEQREMERMDIARDLHDGPLQELSAVNFELVELAASNLTAHQADQLKSAQALLLRQIHEIRAFCNELRPPALAPFGLEKAILSHSDHFREHHPDLRVHLSLVPDQQRIPANLRIALFRIYQEILNNAAKHSKANDLWITLTVEPAEATLEIQDNGVGFEVPQDWNLQARSGHLGLIGMRERAQAINATIEMDSQPGRGTLIRVCVPIA